jgi:uncharacterized protein YajQ (UPF0234 family)
LSEILKIIKRIEIMYKERNKLFEESGLGDYTYSDTEIEKYVAEAIDKEMSKKINQMVKDSGL